MSPVRNQPSASKHSAFAVGLVPVAGKDGRAANQEFAIFGKFEFDIGQRLADGAHAVRCGIVEGDHRRSFGEAVALPHGNAGGGEPLRRVDAERRAAGDPDAHASAEGFADLAVDQLVGELPEEAKRAGGRRRPCRDAARPLRSAQASRRFLTGEAADFCSTAWRIFS